MSERLEKILNFVRFVLGPGAPRLQPWQEALLQRLTDQALHPITRASRDLPRTNEQRVEDWREKREILAAADADLLAEEARSIARQREIVARFKTSRLDRVQTQTFSGLDLALGEDRTVLVMLRDGVVVDERELSRRVVIASRRHCSLVREIVAELRDAFPPVATVALPQEPGPAPVRIPEHARATWHVGENRQQRRAARARRR